MALITAVFAASAATPALASFPGANGRIAFTGNSATPGNRVIYTIEPDGTNQQTVVTSAQDPSWAPDGARLAFTARLDWKIELINPDGSGRASVTNPGCCVALDSDPDWSPDASRIAFGRFFTFKKGSGSALFSIRPDGSDERGLAGGYEPAWSPDGKRIAYVRETVTFEEDEEGNQYEVFDYDIVVLDLETRTSTVLTSGPDLDRHPEWSPDGSQIAFSRAGGVHIMNSDGSGVRRLTDGGSPAWSPDGTKIAFSRDELYTINVEGTGERQITDPGDAVTGTFDADWQPLQGPRPADFKNDAKFCKAERDFWGEDGFRARYGGGANAHGKCVGSN
jgi:Tol biopolymer transport system component